MSNDSIDPYTVLREYDLGTVHSVTEAGGTAGRTWKVAASSGDYFLRLRGVRTSTEARLQFDHGLRDHLMERGVPTASAIRTEAGDKWLQLSGRVYELYPFVVGRSFCPDSELEIANAAKALAEFHKAAVDYRSPLSQKETIAQYTTLGFSDEVSDRMDDPRLQMANMLRVRDLGKSDRDKKLIDQCIARVEQSMHTYADLEYERLTGWVIHGDYTPANLLFSQDGEVVGIFDFDWALPGARCRDVADGLYFFATCPREIDSSNIWSLTDAADFDLDRCIIFMEAYQSVAPLGSHEIDAMPWAFAGRWFSIRLEGMAKVHEDDCFRFFSRQIEKPLLWLDANWARLRKQVS
ncbi:phosphotransferase enzyme family protein [Candidatus Poribacteria bacterium]